MKKEAYKFQFNKNIVVTLSDERLITPSGLCMVGQIFGKSSLAKKAARMKTDKRSQPQIKNGDIIFVRSNGSKELVGRAIMVDNIDFKVTYSGFCIRLRNKEPKKINSKFLLYFFRSDYFRNELQRLSQGSNISNINQDLLSHIKIPLVDIRFQESVVDFLDKKCTAIDTVIEQKQELIEKLTEYKKSLVYECVTGKKEIS